MKGAFEEKDGKLRLKSVISDNVINSADRYLRKVDRDKICSMLDDNFDKAGYPHPEKVFYADHWEAVYIDKENEDAELKLDSSFSPDGEN